MTTRALVLTILAQLAGACVPLVPGPPEPLVDVDGWVKVEGAQDPFAGEGGADVDCPEDAVQVYVFGSEPSLDVTTQDCPRATVAQPALRAGRAGDVVALRGWHELLTAIEPAEAVVALAIDGHELWRGTFPIPSDGGPILAEVSAERSWEAGAPVAWHVHNHGKNSYHLFEVVLRPLVRATDAGADEP